MPGAPGARSMSQRKLAQNLELSVAVTLAEQGQRLDWQARLIDPHLERPAESFLHRRDVSDGVRQREVRAEFGQNVGIPPDLEVVALKRRQPGVGRTRLQLGYGQRSAQPIEPPDGLFRKRAEPACLPFQLQRDERPPVDSGDPANLQFARLERVDSPGERGNPVNEVTDIEVGPQAEGRDQRGVESVASGIFGELQPRTPDYGPRARSLEQSRPSRRPGRAPRSRISTARCPTAA